jgi:ubiquinone/menaquinone biosynthesis C-methylase UbiE
MSSKQYFEDIASKWDDMRSSFFPESVREKAAAKAGVKAGSVAADLGAGSGFVTEELLKHGAKVIAVDQAEQMLEIMRHKFGPNASVEYRLGEAQRLPIESGMVDSTFANMYLHHVEHPAVAIKEMTRIVKPGGKVVITDLDEHNFEFLVTEQHDRWMGFKREDVKRWFEEAGLKNVSVESANAICSSEAQSADSRANVSIFLAYGEKP